MKKFLTLTFILFLFSHFVYAQLSVTKMLGKKANNYRLGYDLFSFWDFPLGGTENKSLRIELMDFAYYPGKTGGTAFETPNGEAYLSVKLGYKYVFSETKTGFYLEPAAGWCRVVHSEEGLETTYGDGVAAAVEGGYSLEVGQRGHAFNFGLKLETDRGSASHTITSLGFRVSYSFNMFRKRGDY